MPLHSIYGCKAKLKSFSEFVSRGTAMPKNPSVGVGINIWICYNVNKKIRCQLVSSQKFSNKDCNKLFTYMEFDIKHKSCAKSVHLLTYVLCV